MPLPFCHYYADAFIFVAIDCHYASYASAITLMPPLLTPLRHAADAAIPPRHFLRYFISDYADC